VATDYRELARQAAKRYGVDPHIFERQIGVESAGYDPNVISGRRSSPAGAQGIAQIMPATARGWHVDPLNPRAALYAAAKNMALYVKQYGNYENALRAYNAGPGAIQASHGYAETNNYVSRILNGRNPTSLGTPVRGGGGAAPQDNSVAQALDPTGGMTRRTVDPGPAVDASSLLQLSSQRGQVPAAAGSLPTPAAMAGPALPAAYRALSSGQAPKARQDIGALISASRTPGQASATVMSRTEAPGAAAGAPAATSAAPGGPGKYSGLVPLGGSRNAGKGSFAISGPQPGRLKPELTAFARKVAYVYGGKLAGLDGSSHSKYTVNGNVSEHYSGNATDIFQIGGKPAQGSVLLRAGRAALIAAGMPRAQALKAGGGLYNVGNHQIIFLTNEGGNHYDHLHISTHAGKR
jgi:hypothetical protein